MLRNLFLGMETFRPQEIILWAVLALTCWTCLSINKRSRSIRASRNVAYLFSIVFAAVLAFLGIIYPENASVFAFYFAFSLLLTAFALPWCLLDLLFLTGIYAGAYALFYTAIIYGLKIPVVWFPRYHPLIDGVILILIAYAIAYIVKRKDIERDVQNFVLLKEVDEKNRQIEEELELAKRVHRTLVPRSIKTERAEINVTYIPMGKVGGDYAKFRFLDKDKLIFFISDVTGHGVPAALLVNRLHAEFERLARETKSPGFLMRELNEFILRDFEGTYMYLSAFCGTLDFKDLKFSYSNYGHPTQYLYRYKNSDVQNLKQQAGLLGVFNEEAGTVPNEHEVSFELGDNILLFTDGVIEAASDKGEFYGEDRVLEVIRKNSKRSAVKLNEALFGELEDFADRHFKDDIFILSIQTVKD